MRAGDVVAVGPLEAVSSSSVNVLGQEFDLSQLGISGESLVNQIGTSVYIQGLLTDNGISATGLFLTGEYSVPGASSVAIAGAISSADPSTGLVKIGDVEVDLNALPGGSSGVQAGQLVAILGTQPVPGGLILGSDRR